MDGDRDGARLAVCGTSCWLDPFLGVGVGSIMCSKSHCDGRTHLKCFTCALTPNKTPSENLDFCPLVNEKGKKKKKRKYKFKICLCHLVFVGCSNTTEQFLKNKEFRTPKLYPLSVCELLPVLLVQCFKDILSTVVSKESWTISFMQLVNIQAPLRVILNFDVFLSKNTVCRKAVLRIPTVLGMAEQDLAPFTILTSH